MGLVVSHRAAQLPHHIRDEAGARGERAGGANACFVNAAYWSTLAALVGSIIGRLMTLAAAWLRQHSEAAMERLESRSRSVATS